MSRWVFAGVALSLVSGCAAFEMRAPRSFEPRSEERDGVVRTESTFQSADGWVHFERSWRPREGARGVLVIVHGLKDHSARYAGFAAGLAKLGIAVRSYDHRGHGRSDGIPQRVDAFGDYLTDLDSFVRRSKEAEPGLPAFVLGHSMGGAIAAGYALDHQSDIAGLLLSAPALATDAGGGAKFGAHVAAALFPGAGAAALDPDKFSRAPEVVAAMKSDPFVDQADVPAGTIAGLLDMMDHIAENRSRFDLPVLAMHGEADQITLPSGSKDFVAGISSKDKTLWMCPRLVHDLLHEPEGNAMADGVGRWLEAHLPARAAPPANSPPPAPAAPPANSAPPAPAGDAAAPPAPGNTAGPAPGNTAGPAPGNTAAPAAPGKGPVAPPEPCHAVVP